MVQVQKNNNLFAMTLKDKYYIDFFSGCGGLSLGLGYAGWNGFLAIEKDPMAFATFKYNLVDSVRRKQFCHQLGISNN